MGKEIQLEMKLREPQQYDVPKMAMQCLMEFFVTEKMNTQKIE